ncbi:MAG: nucleotidyltransferase domain-containing protein [Deltaproteobacteria bacterium]|nr:nucleotidyltransferase domain-containing protein [Deltaproteobacteria bacterium]
MVCEKDAVIRDVKKYIVALRENGIPVERAVLFGSWAKGMAREESDVDVALISSFFTGDRFLDRRKIVPLRRHINNNIEPMPFCPEDFASGGNLVDEIKRYGEDII